jgi:hypothetical protein
MYVFVYSRLLRLTQLWQAGGIGVGAAAASRRGDGSDSRKNMDDNGGAGDSNEAALNDDNLDTLDDDDGDAVTDPALCGKYLRTIVTDNNSRCVFEAYNNNTEQVYMNLMLYSSTYQDHVDAAGRV